MSSHWRWGVAWVLLATVLVPAGCAVARRQPPAKKLTAYLCYEIPNENRMMGSSVKATDQFNERPRTLNFTHMNVVCTPVTKKVHDDGSKPLPVVNGDHLLCYEIEPGPAPRPPTWKFADQFDTYDVKLRRSVFLCEPADKIIEN